MLNYQYTKSLFITLIKKQPKSVYIDYQYKYLIIANAIFLAKSVYNKLYFKLFNNTIKFYFNYKDLFN